MYLRDEANSAPVLPVAIVGAALRFPGAVDPASYHEITSTGRRMFRELAWAAIRDSSRMSDTGPLFSLDGVPLRAALLDDGAPQCRDGAPPTAGSDALAALTTAAALADVPAAGRTAASRTGAIIAGDPAGDPNGPGREGWRLDMGHAGPHLSCSLAAVAAACEVLNSGELDLVLAGGVSTGIDHAWLSQRGLAGTLATEDVRIYDTSPTGTLPGEGCGVVALMRAADARAAGLPVYAEIAGWHVAADGEPGPAALWPAYLRAGVDPMDIQFLEGHGAATAALDQTELSALAAVLGPHANGAPGRCALGAVTANIGDTSSAAGVAALLKTAFAMTTGVIPATVGCVRPHRLLRSHVTPFRLPLAAEPWPEARVRLAAVNSLGVNGPAGSPESGPVHLVLRREPETGRAGRRRRAASWPSPITVPPPRSPIALPPRPGAHVAPPRPRPATDSHSPAEPADLAPEPATPAEPVPGSAGRAELVTPAARDGGIGCVAVERTLAAATVIAVRGADREDLAVTLDTIAIAAERLPAAQLERFARELAATSSVGHGGVRAAILAAAPAELASRAARAAESLRGAGPGPVRAGVYPTDRGRLREAGVYLTEGASGRVVLLFPGLAGTPFGHMGTLSASLATLAAAERLGVRPGVAVGYSLGEITGLAWAGSITFGEAARLAACHAEILRSASCQTAMARVLAGPGVAARLRTGTSLVLAADEGPTQQVLAGTAADIGDLPRRAADLGVAVRVLDVPCGLHSALAQPCAAPWRAAVRAQRLQAPRRRLISTVTGLDVQLGGDVRWLLAAQPTRPALLAGALALASAEADMLLLTAPDAALAAAAASGRAPVFGSPLECRGAPTPSAVAALFAAGALDSVAPFLGNGIDRGHADSPGGELNRWETEA